VILKETSQIYIKKEALINNIRPKDKYKNKQNNMRQRAHKRVFGMSFDAFTTTFSALSEPFNKRFISAYLTLSFIIPQIK
jgi:hypothetical protein